MKLPVFPTHASCARCELHEQPGIDSVGIPTVWEQRSLAPTRRTPFLFCLGQNPGADENAAGIPFIGKSGIYFRGGYVTPSGEPTLNPRLGDWTDGLYLDGTEPSLNSLASVYVTNAVRCWTMDNARPKWKANVKPCFPYTIADFRKVQERHRECDRNVLLALGRPATEAIIKLLFLSKMKGSFFQFNGMTFHFNGMPITFFATYHPAAYMRDNNYLFTINRHLLAVSRFLRYGYTAPVSKPRIVSLPVFLKEIKKCQSRPSRSTPASSRSRSRRSVPRSPSSKNSTGSRPTPAP